MSKFVTLTALALTLLAAPALAPNAWAGEGNWEPFPFTSAPQVTSGAPVVADSGSEAFPSMTGNTVRFSSLAALLPSNGSDGAVQTAQSLPARADEGTVTYVQAQRVNQALALRAARARVVVTDTPQIRG